MGIMGVLRRLGPYVGVAALFGAMLPFASPAAAASAQADPCGPGSNPIVCENSKPGVPSYEWDIDRIGDPSIQGFATDMSVDLGNTIGFKIDTDAADYNIQIYRLGWYGSDGARLIDTITPLA